MMDFCGRVSSPPQATTDTFFPGMKLALSMSVPGSGFFLFLPALIPRSGLRIRKSPAKK